MSVRQALEEFQNHNKLMKQSLEKLRNEVKNEGSYKIQNYMISDQFEEANKVMKMLEEFIKIDLNSNSHEISQFVNTLFKEGFNNEGQPREVIKQEVSANHLTFIEREVLEEVGYTAVSNLKSMKVNATEKNIQDLSQKGFLEYEAVKWGNEEFLVFELTEKGKLYFKTTYGVDALNKKDINVEQTLTIKAVEEKLKEMKFDVIGTRDGIIEINEENKSCYLMLSNDNVHEQMNRYYKLKNIGFISENEEKTSEAFDKVKHWVESNKDKTKLLAVRFATLDNIRQNPSNPFKTIRY